MTKKVYQDNPYIKDITSKIVKKEYSNAKFHIVLDRTIFYPHLSGGQPRDKGTINGIEVIDVYEDGDDIVHVIEENIYEDNVELSIDWRVRLDHMQQHTGQHLLSAAFYKLYNAETIGFHLGSEYVYIDVTMPSISNTDIEKIERYVNQIIYSNFEIKTYIINKSQISSLPLRKAPTVDSNIRIVEIDSIDYSPCGGTHHRNIGEVGIIKIRKWEKYKGNIRIEFLCGYRALKDYSWKNTIINDISNLLSVKDMDSYQGVIRIIDENKDLQRDLRTVREELSHYKTNALVSKGIKLGKLKIIKEVFYDGDFKDIKHISSNIIKEDNLIVLFGYKDNQRCQLLIGQSKNVNLNLKDIFNSVIGIIEGRGGGNETLVQGGGTKTEALENCIDLAYELIVSNF